MEDLFTSRHINALKAMASKIGDLSDKSSLTEHSPIGKNGNVLIPFDTGRGVTAKDLAKNDPDEYKRLVNTESLILDVKDLVGDIG